MRRRSVLGLLGGVGIGGLAGCLGGSGTKPTPTPTPPPLGEIVLWSVLDPSAGTVEVTLTVDKSGTKVYDQTHTFEGESRLSLSKDWMGDAVPYTITVDPAIHNDATTYGTADLDTAGDDSRQCWAFYGDFGPERVMGGGIQDSDHC